MQLLASRTESGRSLDVASLRSPEAPPRRGVVDLAIDAFDAIREGLAVAWDDVAIRAGQLGDVVREPFQRPSKGRLAGWLSVPLAAVGVIAGLALIQGGSADPGPSGAPAAPAAASSGAKFVEQPGYTLALPDGWKQVPAPSGAVLAAEPADGGADATLWIERDGSLSMADFERRSLAQIADLGDAHVVDRVNAPTIDASIVELEAGTAGAPYRVTLRGAGPFRYYLATSVDPGAPAALAGDVELIHGSLRPDLTTEPGEGQR